MHCQQFAYIYPTFQGVREFNYDIQKKVSTHFYNHAAHIFSPFKVNSPGQIVPHDLIPPDDGQGGGLPRGCQFHLKQESCYYEMYVQERGL